MTRRSAISRRINMLDKNTELERDASPSNESTRSHPALQIIRPEGVTRRIKMLAKTKSWSIFRPAHLIQHDWKML